MQKIILKAKKNASVRRYHPWVFSGAVKTMDETITDGDVVEVYDHRDNYLATGHYQDGSICVRLFSFQKTKADQAYWIEKIRQAFEYRQRIGLLQEEQTNCFRLVHGEGDGLPGLIIDIYDQTAVVQCHSIGMHREREKITQALQEIFGEQLSAIYDKSANSLPSQYAMGVEDGYLYGQQGPAQVLENGNRFVVDWELGQKTGFFLDQRVNRDLVGRYASGKTVLNAFCYSGGFSIYALNAGASKVDSVDISQKAIDLTEQNIKENGFSTDEHPAYKEDALQFIQATEQKYDLIILDPPAFAKSIKKRHKAVQGYKRLNALALKKMKPGSILFTFSCSQVVDKPLFYNTIVAAALEARREIRVMHHLSQPPDHPVSLFHPEGNYLKGLVLWVK